MLPRRSRAKGLLRNNDDGSNHFRMALHAYQARCHALHTFEQEPQGAHFSRQTFCRQTHRIENIFGRRKNGAAPACATIAVHTFVAAIRLASFVLTWINEP